MPWRHLALESLTDMHFSTSSDVWAYAVTLYEIFSLGEVPFPGHNFCMEFVYDLKAGLRPSYPPFAPQKMYLIIYLNFYLMKSKSINCVVFVTVGILCNVVGNQIHRIDLHFLKLLKMTNCGQLNKNKTFHATVYKINLKKMYINQCASD